MKVDHTKGISVIHRTTEYKPAFSLSTLLIGRPLPTADAPHQTIGKAIGLAVFASDALSSTAYATQEMMFILIVAGSGALSYSFPIAVGIVILLSILTLSYEQTIHAYPNGGGSYIVSRDNLGIIPALTSAAALLTDYILTVSVSISSGVAQIVSAFPTLYAYRVEIAVALVLFIMLVNLRGVKESGLIFSIPTYFFVASMVITLIVGMIRYLTGSLGVVVEPPMNEMLEITQPLTFFLILRAFSNGTSAVTGVEAISDGITAFKEPRSKNAGTTLIWMATILGVLLLGITFLSFHIQVIPSESETVVSQLVRTVFDGKGIIYMLVIIATTVILVMAANTAFADFPRLGAIVAKDGYLPRQLTYRGSRLVFSGGIILLSLVAFALIVIFQASVSKLIPLYAIGVFLSFTLSQSGMAIRWWKSGKLKPGEELVERGSTLRYDSGWKFKMIVNGFGAITTFVVMLVFGFTKFLDGAYIVIFLIPVLVIGFLLIHRHYTSLAKQLSLDDYGMPPRCVRRRVVLTVAGVHRGTMNALQYARSLSDDVTAVHISIDPEETAKIKAKWEVWGDGVRLEILESPYRLLVEPLLEYVEDLEAKREPNEMINIVVPQFLPKNSLTNFLHSRTANTLRGVLLHHKNIVITEVPYHV